MSIWTSYRLRLQRKRYKIRSRRKGRELTQIADRTTEIKPEDILLFCVFRNENLRLPYFFDYYRKLGINHFVMVDNDSDDGGREYVADQHDASIWTTDAAYGKARFGMDWLTRLQDKYGHGHWALTVDVDELFVFPFCDVRPIRALTDWLDAGRRRSFGALLVDLYPKGPVGAVPYERGKDPLDIINWFDSGNYVISRNERMRNLWIQGGVRARAFFAGEPKKAPALNKVPLVKWHRRYSYVSSTHMILPRGLNIVYDQKGGEKISGALLHTKFLDPITPKSREEMQRGQHYARGREYKAYEQADDTLWTSASRRYVGWQQLEDCGLISAGSWA